MVEHRPRGSSPCPRIETCLFRNRITSSFWPLSPWLSPLHARLVKRVQIKTRVYVVAHSHLYTAMPKDHHIPHSQAPILNLQHPKSSKVLSTSRPTLNLLKSYQHRTLFSPSSPFTAFVLKTPPSSPPPRHTSGKKLQAECQTQTQTQTQTL